MPLTHMFGSWQDQQQFAGRAALAARRHPQEFISDITVTDDGIRTRDVHEWTRIKLGVLTSYLRSYAQACQRAGRFYFVDAMAGPGLCHVLETNEYLLGSTMIALETAPEFAKTLSLEYQEPSAEALIQRTRRFGDRAIVARADCNRDL